MTRQSITTLGFGLALLSLGAVCEARHHGIDQREHHQARRIAQGVRSGELTRPETRHLLRQQAHIRFRERAFRSDGVLTPRERFVLQRDLNRASHAIHREKHDDQRR